MPLTMFDLAGLVEELFDELQLERADVIGYSFGGAIAQQFALQAPERVRRLVLAATLPGWGAVPGICPRCWRLGRRCATTRPRSTR